MTRTALLLGATGLIGSSLLRELLASDDYDTIRLIGRRHPDVADERIETVTCSLDDMERFASAFAVDVVFCCLGTTLRKAGSREAFYRVDHDYCVTAARLAQSQGVSRFLMVSAVNANPRGVSYYARVKGQAERDVLATGLGHVTFMQPSLLEGDRDELRFAEEMGVKAISLVKPLLGWTQADWLPIAATRVAAAMRVAASSQAATGCQRLRYRDMQAMTRDIRPA